MVTSSEESWFSFGAACDQEGSQPILSYSNRFRLIWSLSHIIDPTIPGSYSRSSLSSSSIPITPVMNRPTRSVYAQATGLDVTENLNDTEDDLWFRHGKLPYSK